MSKPVRQGRVKTSQTPLRAALKADSRLHGMVRNGLGAVPKRHHGTFDASVRSSFADSLDVDGALREGNEQENRWDYVLGHLPSRKIIGVEPHSAKNDQINTVILKLAAAQGQLREHLRDGVTISKWLWVASGSVQFLPMEKATLRLAEKGIEFVGRKITHKHLP